MWAVARFAAACASAVLLLAGIGLLIAVGGEDVAMQDAVAWSLWIGGALIAFVSAGGGSPTRNVAESRVVVGGRFTDSPPLPTSPLQYALVGLLCVVVGTFVFVWS
jgi:hypothetical protein